MHILGDARAGDLVLCKATQDDTLLLVDCLEHVSCVKVSALLLLLLVLTFIFFR
jgi:hypothetical protein